MSSIMELKEMKVFKSLIMKVDYVFSLLIQPHSLATQELSFPQLCKKTRHDTQYSSQYQNQAIY